MNVKLENYGNMIVYRCPKCYRELLIISNDYFPFTNSCEHYKVYILRSSESCKCSEDRREVRLMDNNGWMYVICRK